MRDSQSFIARATPGSYFNRKRSKIIMLVLLQLFLFSQSAPFNDANEKSQIMGEGAKQISDINLLLPISNCNECRKVSYNISAINGCYTWEVSHPNLLDLTQRNAPGFKDCANIATIQPISLKSSKSLIWITARDKNSGQMVRCETKLGQIHRLEIQTHFRQFYVDNYEMLHLAYDEEGNIFNSLDGFRFDWNIQDGVDIVKIVTVKDAGQKFSERQQVEDSKHFSYNLFLQGLKSGTAFITVKINELGYEDVKQASVLLTITEPFVIIPSHTVYLLPTSKYQFQLAKVSLKNHEMQFFPIKLPNAQYEWNVDIDTRGDIGEDGAFISKDKEGLVTILVTDRDITNNTAEGSVKVVYPFILDLEIVDVTEQMGNQKTLLVDDLKKSYYEQLGLKEWDSNWVLVEGHTYYIKIFVYDKDKNPIQLTENLVFKNTFSHDYFQVLKQNSIESEIIVKATKATEKTQRIPFVSVLEKIKSANRNIEYKVDQSRLRVEKEVRITKPVSINHPTDLVLLPLIRSSQEDKSGEIWQLEAEGGSGYYQWSIKSDQVAKVSGSGLLRSKEIGQTEVIVRDNLNLRNSYSLKVEVTHVFALTWLEDHIEIEKKNEVATLNVIALDRNGRKFTNCTAVQANYDLKNDNIIHMLPTHHSYEAIKSYVKANQPLLYLKQQFDDNPNAMVTSEIGHERVLTSEKETLIFHNNFGICSQQRIEAVGTGLERIKAYYSNLDQTSTQSFKLIESNYVEIAAYDKLMTVVPNYIDFFSDLFSQNSIQGQDESMFTNYILPNIFDLAFGSSLTWTIHGGTNFWKDIAGKYQASHITVLENQHEGGLDQHLLDFQKVQEHTTEFKYQITCLNPKDKSQFSKPHRFIVTLKQQNLQSRHLLRPAAHYISIGVQCEPPQTQKLYWSQEKRDMNSVQYRRLPRYKVINSEKVSYVLVNTQHYVRSLLFDNSNYVFYNHSSIHNTFASTNQDMLQVYPLKEDYQSQVLDNVYDKRRVQVFNKTGTVHIQTFANGYYRSFFQQPIENRGYGYFSSSAPSESNVERLHLSHEVKDSMHIEIVMNVDIQPKYKSIYLSSGEKNEFKFRILHGSGHFQIHLNNTDLADIIQREGYLTVIPRREGSLEIKVEDVEVPDSVMAVAEILISDIARLELDAPGSLIEQGSKMDLYVTAFDNHGVEFDLDQYRFMDFNVEIETTVVQKNKGGLITSPYPSDKRMFSAQGIEPGNYQLTAYSFKYRPSQADSPYRVNDHHSLPKLRIISEMLRIEVFPLLEIHPGSLLLTPEMRYTLQIIGGPSRGASNQFIQGGTVEIKFEIENSTVATVDAFREVTGHDVGETHLFYEVIQLKPSKNGVEKRSIISKKTIPIRVKLVTSIEIPQNNQRLVFQGSMVKLIGILKYNGETFTHGVAPISYSWNCSNPAIIQLQTPSKEGQNQILGNNIVMASKKLRNNQLNKNDAVFFTQFNSSTIYSLANKQGEALVALLLAIDYPDQYKGDKNYFSTEIMMKVNEQLQINVPEFINQPDKQTHLYLMPPHTQSKIETNKRTMRLKLGYSLQSNYDYSTESYRYTESQTPIIQLVNDEKIITQDKYGKVTVIVEENQAFSNQVVMLNVFITDIFNVAAKDAYQAMNLPLGSTMRIPIAFQSENAHSFAKNIEGISVGIELSHPRVVTATLDEYNSTLTLHAQGSGDCNVIVYLLSNPDHIYDVFRVKVTSIVKPPSPVSIHVGGQVTFKIMGDQYNNAGIKDAQSTLGGSIWSSNNPQILDINQLTGEGKGLSEGKVEVMLSNHINAASIVQVSRIKYAEIDERSRKNLVMVTDRDEGEARFRIKLFFGDQIEEVKPSVQFDGITLIRQNVGLICESDISSIVEATSEISELEGYFCVLRLSKDVNAGSKIPKTAKITVYAYGPSFNNPSASNVLYKDKIISFDVSLISNIKVESRYKNEIKLNRDTRNADIKVFSNVDFHIQVENDAIDDKQLDLIRHKINRTDAQSNEYYLTLAVPREVDKSFKAKVILTHPVTGQKTTLPINYNNNEGGSTGQEGESGYDDEDYENIFTRMYHFIFGRSRKQDATSSSQQQRSSYQETNRSADRHIDTRRNEQPTIWSYLMVLFIILILLFYCLNNVIGLNVREFLENAYYGGNSNQRRPLYRRPMDRGQPLGRNQVRDPIVQRNLFGTVNVGNPPQNQRASPRFNTPGGNDRDAQKGFGQGSVRGMNLGGYNYSGAGDRSSIYHSSGSPRRNLIT